MSLEVKVLRFNRLTKEQQENEWDSGGNWLSVTHNGEQVYLGTYYMEPEDTNFYRDLRDLIETVYNLGYNDCCDDNDPDL